MKKPLFNVLKKSTWIPKMLWHVPHKDGSVDCPGASL